MQDFLNWGKVTAGWGVPEQGGPYFSPGVKVGELVPGHTDIVTVLGIASTLLRGDRPSFLGWQNHPGSKAGSPHGSHGAGGCAGVRSSGADGGKGTEEGIKVLK